MIRLLLVALAAALLPTRVAGAGREALDGFIGSRLDTCRRAHLCAAFCALHDVK